VINCDGERSVVYWVVNSVGMTITQLKTTN